MRPLWFGVLLALQPAYAQSADVRLSLLDSHVYRERELIQADLQFAERDWQFAGILVDPPQECATLATPCFLRDIGFEPGLQGPHGARLTTGRTITINHYVPRLSPGRYQIRALVRRMVYTSTPDGTIGRYADPPQNATSPAIDLTIAPATDEWRHDVVARCVAVLNGADSTAREAAAQQLASLDTPDSRQAALDFLSKAEGVLLSGLSNSRNPDVVCLLMQERVG